MRPTSSGYAEAAEGLEIYYEVYGEGEPIVVLAGGLMPISTMAQIIGPLSDTRQVIAIDLEGHGRTGLRDTPMSVEKNGDDIAAVLRHLGIAEADIVITNKVPIRAAALAMGGGGNAWVPPERSQREALALETVRLAVELGIDVNAANTDGRTALDAAKALKFETVVAYLVEKGAKPGIKDEKDEPTEADPGGMYSSGTAYIYARWMRYHTAIKDKRLRPGMTHTDRKYIDGTYAWGTTFEENLRSDSLRALVDGYSSWFAMTGAHEFGHGCGCGHDTESSRSIMNVVDAVGLRDTQAEWIPDHIKALETALGRYGAKTKR